MRATLDALEQVSDEALVRLRERIVATGHGPAVYDVTEAIAPHLFHALRLPLIRLALRRRKGPEWTLARVFVYDDVVSPFEWDLAAGPEWGPLALECGLVRGDADGIRGNFHLVHTSGVWVFSDTSVTEVDAVMGPGPTTLILERLIPKEFQPLAGRKARVLDLGSGAGTLGLIAAARGAEVVATDLNPRSLRFTALNARFNGVTLDLRSGDLTAPVRGEQFDLVLSQPPFVVRPAGTEHSLYMHGGARGDELALRLLQELPEVLAPDGQAAVLFDTPRLARRSLDHELRTLFAETAVDRVLLQGPGIPSDYLSVGYAYEMTGRFGEEFERTLAQYREHVEGLGVAHFDRALVLLRARPDADQYLAVELSVRQYPTAETLRTLWRAWDASTLDDERFGRLSLQLPASARWVETRPKPVLESDPTCRLTFVGAAFQHELELPFSALLVYSALEKSETVEAAIATYAGEIDATRDEVRSEVLGFLRDSLRRGALEVR